MEKKNSGKEDEAEEYQNAENVKEDVEDDDEKFQPPVIGGEASTDKRKGKMPIHEKSEV